MAPTETAFAVAIALRWEPVFDYTIQVAVKDHGPCSVCRTENITPGQTYVREVINPPWWQEADVDDEGRTIPAGPLGFWGIRKTHAACVTDPGY